MTSHNPALYLEWKVYWWNWYVYTRLRSKRRLVFLENNSCVSPKLTVVKCSDIDQRLGGLFFAQLRMIDAWGFKVNTCWNNNEIMIMMMIMIMITITITITITMTMTITITITIMITIIVQNPLVNLTFLELLENWQWPNGSADNFSVFKDMSVVLCLPFHCQHFHPTFRNASKFLIF